MRGDARTLFLIAVASGLAACAGSDLEDLEESSGRTPMLSGGLRARDGQFPATVYIPDCTASKIGAHELLTAAHCVVDPASMTLRSSYRRGAKLTIWTGVDLGKDGAPHRVTVRETRIHPSYAARLVAAGGDGIASRDFVTVDDLALVRITEETPEVGTGMLSFAPLGPGTRVVVGGYGLTHDRFDFGAGTFVVEGDIEDGEDRPTAGLQCAPTTVSSREGTVQKIRNGKELPGGSLVVQDGLSPETDLKLLPGDSGGPVYRDDRKASEDYSDHVFLTIVGVSSFSGLFESAFARIDDDGPGACLRTALRASPGAEAPLPLLCPP